jgi:hypothetical protein
MAETTYTYSISSDFPNGAFESSNLLLEIRASPITVSLKDITWSESVSDSVNITFNAELPPADKTLLDGDIDSPCGGLIAQHDHIPKDFGHAKTTTDGKLYTIVLPQTDGYQMCDRDFRLNTCIVDSYSSQVDAKINISTRLESSWNELSLVGVYKSDGTAVADQADADANGVLSVWDYAAKTQDGTAVAIPYELRGGCVTPDESILLAEKWDHRIYAVGAPGIPASYGGQVRLFDGYLGHLAGEVLNADSPSAKKLDPSLGAGASVIRIYIFHPAGKKVNHILRLTTYRPAGTF